MKEKSLKDVEFETKYPISSDKLVEFKQIMERVGDLKSFLYVEGPDTFYTYPKSWFDENPQWDPEGTFIRYRKPSFGLDKGRRQVTWKYLPTGSIDNIQRTEYNWDIGNTPEDSIIGQIEHSGAKKNATIVKNCHIYKFEDATVVFYAVYDTTFSLSEKADHFIEIEVDEENISKMEESEAWDIIEKYENILLSLGVNKKARLKKSLFQMYKK